MKLAFTKMEGAGNDFVVLDCTWEAFTLSPSQLKHLADRHTEPCHAHAVFERPGVVLRNHVKNPSDA